MITLTSKQDKAQLKEHAFNLLKQRNFEGLIILVEVLRDTNFESELKESDFSTADKNNYLKKAAGLGHLEIVKYLIDSGSNIHLRNNETLRWAVYQEHREIIKHLIENGANINVDGSYVLRWAAEYGHLDVVKCCVENGADILTDDSYALRIAVTNEHTEVVEYLEGILKNDRNHN